MATSSRDRISVDLQGLKMALVSRADAMGVSPSDVVRILLVDALAVQPVNRRADVQRGSGRSISGDQRVSLRMDRAHVLALNEAAHRSGLSQGAYVAGLLDGVAALGGGRATDPVPLRRSRPRTRSWQTSAATSVI